MSYSNGFMKYEDTDVVWSGGYLKALDFWNVNKYCHKLKLRIEQFVHPTYCAMKSKSTFVIRSSIDIEPVLICSLQEYR